MRDGRIRPALLAACVLALFVLAALLPPVLQPADYHRFADRRSWLGVANFADVVSNLPLLLVALFALAGPAPSRPGAGDAAALPWRAFWLALVYTALASAWFHLRPDDARLLWDRLGISLAFAALAAAVLAERHGARTGRLVLAAGWILGPVATLHWYAGSVAGAPDLRYYALAQAVPAAVLALALPGAAGRASLAAAMAAYALALGAELGDRALYAATGWISGHTLKHLLAALAAYWLLRRRSGSAA